MTTQIQVSVPKSSALPPISQASSNPQQQGTSNKYYSDSKSGRVNLPSNNTQKKKKKYRYNTQGQAQQQKAVVQAYGINTPLKIMDPSAQGHGQVQGYGYRQGKYGTKR